MKYHLGPLSCHTSGGWKRTNPTTGRVVHVTVRIDPEGNETDALFELVDVEGR